MFGRTLKLSISDKNYEFLTIGTKMLAGEISVFLHVPSC